jgi:hypothetical protein
MEEEGIAVATEDKWNFEGLGVGEGLLDPSINRVIVVLGFDDGDGDVRLVVEDVVSALLRTSCMKFPPDINSPIRETDFLTNLCIDVPARRYQVRRDELRANVALVRARLSIAVSRFPVVIDPCALAILTPV